VASCYQGQAIAISLSIAEYHQGDDMDSLLKCADQVLFRAKREACNSLVVGGTDARQRRGKPTVGAKASDIESGRSQAGKSVTQGAIVEVICRKRNGQKRPDQIYLAQGLVP
jgi:hypothetical protein